MLSPGYWYARFLKIGALARLGRPADRDLAIMRKQYPDFSPERANYIPFADKTHNRRLIASYEAATR